MKRKLQLYGATRKETVANAIVDGLVAPNSRTLKNIPFEEDAEWGEDFDGLWPPAKGIHEEVVYRRGSKIVSRQIKNNPYVKW